MARNWRNPASVPEGLGSLEFIRSHLYPRLLAGLYFVVGHSTAAAVIFNTVLGVSSVYLVYRLGVLLLGPAAARWAGWQDIDLTHPVYPLEIIMETSLSPPQVREEVRTRFMSRCI